MSKSLKKLVALLLVAVMTMALLAGCSEKEEPTDTKAEVTEDTQEESKDEVKDEAKEEVAEPEVDPYEPKDEKYTLAWVAYQKKPVEEDAYIIKMMEEKFNVDVEYINVDSGTFDEVMGIKMASGEIPDLFYLGAGNRFEKLQQFYEMGVLAEIPLEVIEKYAPNYYASILADYPESPGAFDYTKMDGKNYALPDLNYGTTNRLPIVYRGDWMEAVGVDKTPETIEEFETLIYKFAKEDPDGNGKDDTYGLSRTALNAVFGAYGYIVGGFPYVDDCWVDKDGQLVFGPAQPELKEALAYITKWYEDGVLDPEFITGENDGGYWALSNAFVNEKIGVTSRGSVSKYQPTHQLIEGAGDSLHVAELRKVNPVAADSLMFGLPLQNPNTGEVGGTFKWNMVIPNIVMGVQLEDQPDKMGKILQMLDYGAESFDQFYEIYMGIEGEHYEYPEGSSSPKFIGELTFEDVGGGALFNAHQPYAFIEQIQNPALLQWYKDNEFDQHGINNGLMASLPSGVMYTEELKKIQEEAFVLIITGDKPLDYYDEYMETWKASGGDILTEEANAWYKNVK